MFNDEIQEIRLKAIQVLTTISTTNILLRDDQIDIILSVLEDSSPDIREALHQMLSHCTLSSVTALRSTIQSLLENLKRYSMDKDSIWRCFQSLGANNAQLVHSIVNELLMNHPFFRLTEKTLDDMECK